MDDINDDTTSKENENYKMEKSTTDNDHTKRCRREPYSTPHNLPLENRQYFCSKSTEKAMRENLARHRTSLHGKMLNFRANRNDARYRRLQAKIYNFLERPKTIPSIFYHILIFGSVLVCLMFSVLSTIKDYDRIAGEALLYTELVMLFWFFTEYCLRMWSAGCRSRYQTWKGRIQFAKRPFCLVDVIVIIASIAVLVIGSDGQKIAASAFRGLRFFQILRMIRMDRRGGSWKLLASVVWAHRQELFTTVYIGFLGLIFSSFLLYLVEKDENDHINSYADALWWGVITLCTVGYGDSVPQTWMGKIIAGCSCLSIISFYALPPGILGSGFALKVQQHQRQKHLIRRRVPAATLIQCLWRCYAADPNSTSVATWKIHMKAMSCDKNITSRFSRFSSIKRRSEKSMNTSASAAAAAATASAAATAAAAAATAAAAACTTTTTGGNNTSNFICPTSAPNAQSPPPLPPLLPTLHANHHSSTSLCRRNAVGASSNNPASQSSGCIAVSSSTFSCNQLQGNSSVDLEMIDQSSVAPNKDQDCSEIVDISINSSRSMKKRFRALAQSMKSHISLNAGASDVNSLQSVSLYDKDNGSTEETQFVAQLTETDRNVIRAIRKIRFFVARKKFREALRPYDVKDVMEQYSAGHVDMLARIKTLQSRLDLILGSGLGKDGMEISTKISLASRIIKVEKQVESIEDKLDLIIDLISSDQAKCKEYKKKNTFVTSFSIDNDAQVISPWIADAPNNSNKSLNSSTQPLSVPSTNSILVNSSKQQEKEREAWTELPLEIDKIDSLSLIRTKFTVDTLNEEDDIHFVSSETFPDLEHDYTNEAMAPVTVNDAVKIRPALLRKLSVKSTESQDKRTANSFIGPFTEADIILSEQDDSYSDSKIPLCLSAQSSVKSSTNAGVDNANKTLNESTSGMQSNLKPESQPLLVDSQVQQLKKSLC